MSESLTVDNLRNQRFTKCYGDYVHGYISAEIFNQYLDEVIFIKSSDELSNILISCVDMGIELINKFIEAGANPRHNDDRCFILVCTTYPDIELAKFFLDLGADINAQNGKALTKAITHYFYDDDDNDETTLPIIKFLLENQIRVTDDAILEACRLQEPDVFKLFLEYDINANILLKHLLNLQKTYDGTDSRPTFENFTECLQVISSCDPDFKLVVDQLYNNV